MLQPGERMHHTCVHMLRVGLRFVRADRGGCIFLAFLVTGACDVFLLGESARARGGVALPVYGVQLCRVVQRNVGR
jgi:hypothetical protein